MKRILFLTAAIVLSTTIVFAQDNYVDMQQELQGYYNELFKTPEQMANETEYELRHTNDVRAIRSQLEKLRYTLFMINKEGIPETQKVAKKRAIEREIEYYEYRLDKLQNR